MGTDARRIPVAIAGGGPVGLMLALFLDRFGVRTVLFNDESTTRWHPKGSTQGSRTMEHFRRLGIAGAIRRLGLPADHPTDVAYFTRYSGYELARIKMPSTDEVERAIASSSAIDQNPEPIFRANQMLVERFLLEHAATRPNIVLRFGWHMDSFSRDDDGVNIRAVPSGGGPVEHWRAEYLAGCDGGRSTVRRGLGIRFQGDAGIEQRYFGGRMYATYVRAPNLYRDHLGRRRAWQYWAVNPEIRSSLIAINGKDEFLFRTQAATADQPPSDDLVGDMMRRCVGADTALDIVAHEPWTAGMALVADSFGEGRVFMAGDAVHLFTPTGGFGMNTGIDDAVNLAWKLAAMVQGWGGKQLLASYETERRPIAFRNTGAARQFTANIGETDVDPAIEQNSAAGAAARDKATAMLAGFGEQFASIGVQLGARYDGSPLIASDAAPPSDSFTTYIPSSVPGGRAPHVWLGAGRDAGDSIFDRLGHGFSLLRFDGKSHGEADLVAAAARRKLPLSVLDIDNDDARDLYGCDLALVRPDQIIAWRGRKLPDNPHDLLARVAGGPF